MTTLCNCVIVITYSCHSTYCAYMYMKGFMKEDSYFLHLLKSTKVWTWNPMQMCGACMALKIQTSHFHTFHPQPWNFFSWNCLFTYTVLRNKFIYLPTLKLRTHSMPDHSSLKLFNKWQNDEKAVGFSMSHQLF